MVLVVLIVVGSIASALPSSSTTAGKRSAHVLGEWNAWLETNNATVTFVVLLVFGVVLIGQGIGGL